MIVFIKLSCGNIQVRSKARITSSKHLLEYYLRDITVNIVQ